MLKVSPISITQGEAAVPGVLIFGDDLEEALAIAEMTRDHYEIPGPKGQITLRFTDADNGTVNLSINFDPQVGEVNILGANREILENLISGLKSVEKYVVLLGYDHDRQNVVDPKTFSLFKSDFLYEDQHISGQPIKKVNWNELF